MVAPVTTRSTALRLLLRQSFGIWTPRWFFKPKLFNLTVFPQRIFFFLNWLKSLPQFRQQLKLKNRSPSVEKSVPFTLPQSPPTPVVVILSQEVDDNGVAGGQVAQSEEKEDGHKFLRVSRLNLMLSFFWANEAETFSSVGWKLVFCFFSHFFF